MRQRKESTTLTCHLCWYQSEMVDRGISGTAAASNSISSWRGHLTVYTDTHGKLHPRDESRSNTNQHLLQKTLPPARLPICLYYTPICFLFFFSKIIMGSHSLGTVAPTKENNEIPTKPNQKKSPCPSVTTLFYFSNRFPFSPTRVVGFQRGRVTKGNLHNKLEFYLFFFLFSFNEENIYIYFFGG